VFKCVYCLRAFICMLCVRLTCFLIKGHLLTYVSSLTLAPLLALLCENVTLSTKPKRHNASHCRQRITGNVYLKFVEIWTCVLRYESRQGDRQTYRLQYFSPRIEMLTKYYRHDVLLDLYSSWKAQNGRWSTMWVMVVRCAMYNVFSAEELIPDFDRIRVLLHSDGRLHWEPGGIFKTTCDIDIGNFPFDTQHCPMLIGAYSYYRYVPRYGTCVGNQFSRKLYIFYIFCYR